MSFPVPNITLVGCGAMGAALLKGWLNAGVAQEYWVIAPRQESVQPFLEQSERVHWYSAPDELPDHASVLVIALKPFLLAEVLPLYKAFLNPDCLVITVATGKSLQFYKDHLDRQVIRAMPNTPVSINKGVIGLVADASAVERWAAKVDDVLGALGYTTWVSNEGMLNQVTALSGSGPAYVFYMIEALARAGAKHGLSHEQAYEMALYTVAGAGAYALESGIPASTLRENVTSPKGTTEQALKILMSPHGMDDLMSQAVEAAYERAKELTQ